MEFTHLLLEMQLISQEDINKLLMIITHGGDLFPTISVQIQLVFADEDFGIGRNRNLFNEGIKND